MYIDKPDREVVYEMMKKLLEIKDVTLFHRDGNGNALNESQFYVCKIILWALEKRYYWDNHEVLKLCLAVNIPFLDDFLFVDTFGKHTLLICVFTCFNFSEPDFRKSSRCDNSKNFFICKNLQERRYILSF